MKPSKENFNFPHDYNAKDDPKCMLLIEQMGLEGYGIFWVLLETLRVQEDYKCHVSLVPPIARRYGTSIEKVKCVILNYNLFTIEGNEFFYSAPFRNRMLKVDGRSKTNKAKAIKAAASRWGSSGLALETTTENEEFFMLQAMHKQCSKHKECENQCDTQTALKCSKQCSKHKEPETQADTQTALPAPVEIGVLFSSFSDNLYSISNSISKKEGQQEHDLIKAETPKALVLFEQPAEQKHYLQILVEKRTENVCKMKKQLTFDKAKKLEGDYGRDVVVGIIQAMENRVDLTKKNLDVNLTIRNWLAMRGTKPNTSTKGSGLTHKMTL